MIRKCLQFIAFSPILICLNSAYAVDDTSDITVSVEHIEYVNLIGDAVGASRVFAVEDIQPAGRRGPGPTVAIGTLGLESNMPGNCTMNFSTINSFKLRHVDSNKRLTNYRLDYRGVEIKDGSNEDITMPCNVAASSLDFTAIGRFRKRAKSGYYRDVVTITVTTE